MKELKEKQGIRIRGEWILAPPVIALIVFLTLKESFLVVSLLLFTLWLLKKVENKSFGSSTALCIYCFGLPIFTSISFLELRVGSNLTTPDEVSVFEFLVLIMSFSITLFLGVINLVHLLIRKRIRQSLILSLSMMASVSLSIGLIWLIHYMSRA